MTTSSVLTEEQLTLVKPDEGAMIERGEGGSDGFDRSAIRQEIAPTETIDASTEYVEEGSATFVSGDSDMPTGPAAVGESIGNIELIREVGDQQFIPKYVHGFTVDIEDREVDESWLADMRDGIMEIFDIQADLAFLQGLDREDGTEVFPGVFEWLDNNVPSSNIINCNDFDLSAGDLNGVPANIVTREAYEQINGFYVESQWDIAVAKHPIWARWNEYGTFDGATVESQWDLVQADRNDAAVGVNRRLLVPQQIGLPTAPSESGEFVFDIDFPSRTNSSYSSPLSDAKDDVMYLIPNHGGDFYELYEQPSPDVSDPIRKEGWQERFEYKWRAGVVYGQNRHQRDTDVAQDAIKLENVTALFD